MAILPRTNSGEKDPDQFSPKSSFLENVKYDRKANALDITFKSGSLRRYLSCSPATFESFKSSPDHSSFYARALKGRLASVPIVEKTIGRLKTEPLKKVYDRRTLDDGIKRKPAGTVARAFGA